MSVYFISDGRGHIKIGRSANPAARMAALQTATALKLKLLGTIPGDAEVEQNIHGLFDEDREVGEWFRITDRLVHFGYFMCGYAWGPDPDFWEVYREWLELRGADELYGRVLYGKHDWSHAVQAA